MGCCQNHPPFLGTLNIRCCIMIGIQKGTIILTTTHMTSSLNSLKAVLWGSIMGVIKRDTRSLDPRP